MKYSIIFLVFIIFIFNCSKHKTNSSDKNLTAQNGKVVLMGSSDDPELFNYINILGHTNFFRINYKQKEIIEGNTWKMVLDSIFKPKFLEVFVTLNDNIYRTQLYVASGDTVKFEIKENRLKFIGEKAVFNNFYAELYKSTPNYFNNSYKGNLYDYKDSVKSIYDQKQLFLNQYVNEHKITSENFVSLVKEDMKFEYFNDLVNPRIVSSESEGLFYGNSDELFSLIQKEYKENTLFSFKNYFDDINIDDFKKLGGLQSLSLKNCINDYIRYYFNSSNNFTYTKEDLLAEKKFIEDNFNDELETYAIAKMIVDYTDKGFGRGTNNIEFMKQLIEEYKNKSMEPSYQEKMNEIKSSLENFNFSLSEYALETKLISKFGDTITLKNIFSRSDQKVYVMDFWASWCPPCINEITKAKDFKDKLTIESDVEWIYLSIDKDENKWLKKSNELKNHLNVRNQYLVIGGKNSALAKSLKVSWIPRYVILNAEHKIVLNNAPRPSDSINFKKIINDISLREQ